MTSETVVREVIFQLWNSRNYAGLWSKSLADKLESTLSQPEPVAQGAAVAWLATYINNGGLPDVYVSTHHDLAIENDIHGTPIPLYATLTITTGHRVVHDVPEDFSLATDGFGINKPVNAMLADALRFLAKPGQKVIWRGSLRWFDDDGVLSNHYDGMDIDQLAREFDYEVHYNAHHAALVSKISASPSAGGV